MNPCIGIPRCISLKRFVFDRSLLGQDEKLNLYFFPDKLHSGLDENPRGNLRYNYDRKTRIHECKTHTNERKKCSINKEILFNINNLKIYDYDG
jgi:hypothetical protein